MTALTENICSLRLQQKDSSSLLPPSTFEPWINQAETRIKRLGQLKPLPETDEFIEADCLIHNLDEFQERRADLIWELARDGAGDVDLMTQREADIYDELVGLAEDLRGEAV